MNNTRQVLIVEDHHLLRAGLRSMVSDLDGYEVTGEAVDGKQACLMALSLAPDLILMDLSMPGMNGLEATAVIKRRSPHIRIIALTAHSSEEYVREALRMGVDGYVLKDASFEDLVLAMRAVIQGKKHLSPDVCGTLVDSYVGGGNTPRAKTVWELLTARERVVLKLVAEGRTNRQAAQYLNLSPKTIEKYRASLMHKLEITNLTGLVRAAIKMGLIPSAPQRASPEPELACTRVPVLEQVYGSTVMS